MTEDHVCECVHTFYEKAKTTEIKEDEQSDDSDHSIKVDEERI
jgi:hypothetical protein